MRKTNIFAPLSLALLLFGGLTITAQDDNRHLEIGAWSTPVNGLQGRLSAAFGKDFNGTRMVDVYLELRNVSDVGNPMEIYFDEYTSVKSSVVDADAKALKLGPTAASIISPGPFWLSIPSGGNLRFPVSVSGYGIFKDSGMDIPMTSGNWVIAPADKKQYYLSADFTNAPTTDKRRAWTGTLHLPKVQIPR